MQQAPIPKNEKERLVSLHKLGLLDTKPEERFDRITQIAVKIFSVSISTLTLVDAKREWFKSCVGLPVKEGDRAISFCGHALLTNNVFIIPDTKKDKRFADNPMVVGKPFIRFYAGVPILSEDGERVGVFCIKDTKPRKFSKHDKEILIYLGAWAELEVNSRNLSFALAEEKKINKAKSEFVSIASHQLRTPLSTINWYAEMLLAGDAGKLNPEQKKYFNEIYTGNQRMVALINALLNVFRLELGAFIIEPEPTNVVELVQSVVNEQKPMIDEKKLKLNEKYAENLPKLNADPKLLRMVVQNLLSNAANYTPEDGKIEISISMNDKKNLLLKVSDTGYGIPKSQQDKIFTKLFRADNVREKETEGTGLGLYIVKAIIEHSGGKVWFESEENKGTTFYVTLSPEGMKKKEGSKALS